MKVFKYWARATASVDSPQGPWELGQYAGSNESPEQAQQRAEERVRVARQRLSGQHLPPHVLCVRRSSKSTRTMVNSKRSSPGTSMGPLC